MHFSLLTVLAALGSTVAAVSTYDVVNYCDDKKYLTLSNNNGVQQFNAELPGGTSRHYEINGANSLAIANTTDYWSASTSKLVLGTNTASGILYYALGLANGYPLRDRPFTFTSTNSDCPPLTAADGSTKGCADNNVNFRFVLCSSDI